MIITIDGPSGTGKTTVARRVAERLRFIYFDTGAMYRAFTWLVLERNVDINDPRAVERCLIDFDYKVVETQGEKRYFVGSIDVTQAIRSQSITGVVSSVSALKQVRTFLLDLQYHFAQAQDAVFEGRDLGTVVFPQAELKIYLTADPAVRAERRRKELLAALPQEESTFTAEHMLDELMRRDAYDSSREVAPLRCASDAFQIDTTHLSIDQVVDQIVDCCLKRFPDKKKHL
jgi:cytidylate kinase